MMQCIDPVVGKILAGWRYDISGITPEMRVDYEALLKSCELCRSRQRLHRTIDVALIVLASVSAMIFLLAYGVIRYFGPRNAFILEIAAGAGFLLGQLREQLGRGVTRSIIDEDDLPGLTKASEKTVQASVELRDGLFLVEHGDDNREGGTGLCHGGTVYTANAASVGPKTATKIRRGRVSNLPFRPNGQANIAAGFTFFFAICECHLVNASHSRHVGCYRTRGS